MLDRGNFGPEEEVKPDLSPMIDCVFILLIFFIVTTVFVKEPGVDVDKPTASEAAALEKNSIIFAVTAENKIFYGGDVVSLSGVRQIVKPLLLEKENVADAHVIIKGDAEAEHGIISDLAKECLGAGVLGHRVTVSTDG